MHEWGQSFRLFKVAAWKGCRNGGSGRGQGVCVRGGRERCRGGRAGVKGGRLGRGRAAAVLGPEAMFVPRLEVVRARRRRGFSAGPGAGLEEPEEVLGGGCRRGGGGTGNQEW
jgi:hypothetical protein